MISIFADLPRPSSATTVTTIGGAIRPRPVAADLLYAEQRMPRDADAAVAANGDDMHWRLEAAAVDELTDELAEAFLIGRGHRAMIANLQARFDHRHLILLGGFPSRRWRRLRAGCTEWR